MKSDLKNKLEEILSKEAELEKEMNSGEGDIVALSKSYGEIVKQAKIAKQIVENERKIQEAQELATDKEMHALAKIELGDLSKEQEMLENEIKSLLLPQDPSMSKDIFLEIRAGTGGIEAALFASDLARLYERYASFMNWSFGMVDCNKLEAGGYKEYICKIEGKNVYGHLLFESGVHRIQRVPKTESGGRIHTSAATVVALPILQEEEFVLNEEELRVDTFKASGAGGQHVNKTESAVRITHLPTAISVVQQSERSQHRNRAKAMDILRSKLYSLEEKKKQEKLRSQRSLAGSGDRSERIRTYNVLQNRVTDHRISWSSHNLEGFMLGEEIFSELVCKLKDAHQKDLIDESFSLDNQDT